MFTCKEMTELVTDFLEGKLSWGDWLKFQFHLGMCVHCREYLNQMKATVNALGELPDDLEMPPEVRDDLLERFRTWKEDPREGSENPELA